MVMRNLLLLLLFTSFTIIVKGQEQLVGLKSGICQTNVAQSDLLDTTNSRVGFSGGVTYEYMNKKHFSFGADFIYNQRGYSRINEFEIEGKSTYKYNFQYLSIPLKACISFGKRIYGFVNIGLVPSFTLNAKAVKTTFDIDGNVLKLKEDNFTKSIKAVDFGGMLETGLAYMIRNKYSLFSAITFQKSFTPLNKSEYAWWGSAMRHYGFTFSLGVKYSFRGKI